MPYADPVTAAFALSRNRLVRRRLHQGRVGRRGDVTPRSGPERPSSGWAGLENDDDQQLLTRVRECAQEQCPQARVVLFGSRAKGIGGPDSDYDLLVILPDDIDHSDLTKEHASQVLAGLRHRPGPAGTGGVDSYGYGWTVHE